MSVSISSFESNLLDTITALVMAPINAAYCLLWLIWQAAKAIAPYRRYIALAIVAMAFVGACVAVPALPVGLGLVAAFAVTTKPGERS